MSVPRLMVTGSAFGVTLKKLENRLEIIGIEIACLLGKGKRERELITSIYGICGPCLSG